MPNVDIISVLYPCYLIQFFLGCGPIKISKTKTNIKVTYRVIYDYTTRIILILIIFFIIHRYSSMESFDFGNSALIKFMTTSYFLIVGSTITVNVVYTKIQKNNIGLLVKKLYDIDYEFKSNGMKVDYRKIKWASIRFLAIGITTFSVYTTYRLTSQNLNNKLQASLTYGLLYFGALHHIISACSFITHIQIITNQLQKMEKVLSYRMFKPYLRQKLTLTKIMCLHQDLYDILILTNQVHSLQLLLSFAVTFIIITFQTYSLLCDVYSGPNSLNKYSLGTALWIVISFIEKISLTFACHKCMFTETLLKHSISKIMAMHSNNKELSKKLNAFNLQLLHEKFEISAGNLFIIDLPIFISVCGAATTYIILLWQSDTKIDLHYPMKKVFGVL